ncbi:hypothetical protein [Streptomyces sp. NBC_01276]|uniref:hypothetical protein n=1 Tax=Streptomyces sp. NBC_01276 TaxID=2903808 RepID=UPI00352C2DE6
MPLHIAFGDPAALRARCEVATARAASPDDVEYEPGSVVPSGQWRPMADADLRAVSAPRRPLDSTLVEIVRPPFRDGLPLEDLIRPMGDPEAVYLGQALARAGMATTTDNYRDGRLVGLHLDNWDKLPYAEKHTARRRLCLNLGPGSRYVILGALDAQAVCRAVHPEDHHEWYPHTEDYRAYVAGGQSIPLTRIRLDRGEGYLAPTEYLLHDGSTEHQEQPSTAAFWLGRWPRGILPSLV